MMTFYTNLTTNRSTYAIPGLNSTYLTDISLTERVLEAVILSVICIIALLGNVALWIIILKNASFRTASNALLLCLSAADLLVSVFNMPVAVYTIAVGKWPLSHAACVIAGFVTMVTFIASVMSLGVISIHRYLLICHAAKSRKASSKRNITLMIIGTWTLSVALATPPLLGWGKYDYLLGQSFCFCNWKTSVSYTFFMVGTCFGGPCSVMSFSYIGILREFRASQRRVGTDRLSIKRTKVLLQIEPSKTSVNNAEQNGKDIHVFRKALPRAPNNRKILHEIEEEDLSKGVPNVSPTLNGINKMQSAGITGIKKDEIDRNSFRRNNVDAPLQTGKINSANIDSSPNQNSHKDEKQTAARNENFKLATAFLVVILGFVILWMPFCITMFCSVFGVWVPRIADMATLLLGFMNSACNPIIYGVMNKKFKKEFIKILFFKHLCNRTKVNPVIQVK